MHVHNLAQAATARREANALLAREGFSPKETESLALAASELATNIVKYAGRGTVSIRLVRRGDQKGVEIVAADRGPGIANPEDALRDGHSTGGSLGYGLGAVNRAMDDLDIVSSPGNGTTVRCRRWLRAAKPSGPSPLDFGVVCRPKPGERVCGDAFVLRTWAESALVGVIDGVGHGQPAHQASRKAREYVESHYDQPLDRLFRGTSRACRGTRGAVMALARIDWRAGTVGLASVGNIELKFLGMPRPHNLIAPRGLMGLRAQPVREVTAPWLASSALVFHSDGLHTRWGAEDLRLAADASAQTLAAAIFKRWAKDVDDATVLVVSNKAQ